MATPAFLVSDYEHAFKAEVTFNTDPGPPVGADFMRLQTPFPWKRLKERRDRDSDKDNSASVSVTQGGREKSDWTAEGDIIPSGNGTTPTAPDADVLFEANLGQKNTCTAHTTTAAGSSGVTLNLTPGGGAASGIPTGGRVIIAVDVDATLGYEARRVASRATDAVTLTQTFTGATNPAASRTVKVCAATYAPLKSALKTLHGYTWLNGNNFRQRAGGLIAQMLEINLDGSQGVPVPTMKFSGPGAQIAPHTTSKPTPTLAGDPLAATEAKVWFGATKHCLTSFKFSFDNSIELRESEFCNLFPTGPKRTKNKGKFVADLEISFLLQTGTIEGYHDNADGLQAYDVMIQIGVAPGAILAINVPRFIPDVEPGEVEGEVALTLKGRCYASAAGEDEAFVAFL
jgi:hypothetical protein